MTDLQTIPLGTLTLNTQVSLPSNIKEYVEESITEVKNENYTSFEVFPTKHVIPSGCSDNVESLSSVLNWNAQELQAAKDYGWWTNMTYSSEVPINDTCFLEFYTTGLSNDDDVRIQWGDGEISVLKDCAERYRGGVAHIRHQYSMQVPFEVKVYGSTYYLVRNSNNLSTDIGEAKLSKKSIVRGCFGERFKLADCVTNLAAFMRFSDRLLSVYVPFSSNVIKQRSWCNLFQDSINLLCADFEDGLINSHSRESHMIFSGCKNLKSVPGFRMSDYGGDVKGYYKEFCECNNLEGDILDLLPLYGFSQTTLYLEQTFKNCRKLSCSNYTSLGNILWNNIDQKYASGSANCFSGCTNLTLSVIPYELGGTYNEYILNNNNSIETVRNMLNQNIVNVANDGDGQCIKYSSNPIVSYESYSKLSSNGNVINADTQWCLGDKSQVEYVYKLSKNFDTLSAGFMRGKKNLISFKSDEITAIYDNSFNGCTNLSSVDASNVLCCDKDSNFNNCSSLINVNLPKCERLYFKTFYGCKKLSSIVISPNFSYFGGQFASGISHEISIDLRGRTNLSAPYVTSPTGSNQSFNGKQIIILDSGMSSKWQENKGYWNNWNTYITNSLVTIIEV